MGSIAITNSNASKVVTTTTVGVKEGLDINLLNSLVPDKYDYISLGYTGSNLTSVVYKLGGSGGTTVATLTLAYSGSTLTSVTRT